MYMYNWTTSRCSRNELSIVNQLSCRKINWKEMSWTYSKDEPFSNLVEEK